MTSYLLTYIAGCISTGIAFGLYQIVGPQVMVYAAALLAVTAFAIVFLAFNRGGLVDERPLSSDPDDGWRYPADWRPR